MSDLAQATATTTKVGSTISAVVNGTTVTVECARDLTVAVGDVLIVGKVGASWFALARVFAAAPLAAPNDAPPTPNPPAITGTLVVSPVETRSYRNGAWRTDTTQVIQGQYGGGGNHTGAAFYGSAPRSLAGATVIAASIQVRRDTGGVFAAGGSTMRLITQATRPGGAPTLTSSTAGPSLAVGAAQSAFAVPSAWVQSMVDGTAGGLGFFTASASPYVRFAGIGDWSPAFSLTIYWSRG